MAVYACVRVHMCIKAETSQHLAVNTDRPAAVNLPGRASTHPSVYTHLFSLLHDRVICRLQSLIKLKNIFVSYVIFFLPVFGFYKFIYKKDRENNQSDDLKVKNH